MIKFVNALDEKNESYVILSKFILDLKHLWSITFFKFITIIYETRFILSHHCYLTLKDHFLFENIIGQCLLSFIECSKSR